MLRLLLASPSGTGCALSGTKYSTPLVGTSVMKNTVVRMVTGHRNPATMTIDCGAGRKAKKLWTMSIRVPNPIEPSPTFLHSLAHLTGGRVGELKRRRPVLRTLLCIALASAFWLGLGYWFVEEMMERESKSRKWWTMEPFGTAEEGILEIDVSRPLSFVAGVVGEQAETIITAQARLTYPCASDSPKKASPRSLFDQVFEELVMEQIKTIRGGRTEYSNLVSGLKQARLGFTDYALEKIRARVKIHFEKKHRNVWDPDV